MGERECGQVIPLVALLVLVVGGAMSLLAMVTGEMNEASRAQTAADAAALAAVSGGERAARTAAEANGGRLIRLDKEGTEAQVVVRIDDHEAAARAKTGRGLATNR